MPRRLAVRRGLADADVLLVASPGQAEQWRASGCVRRSLPVADVMEASTTMTPLPREEARRASGVEGSRSLLWVGRLNANKDPLTVLRGFAQFSEGAPNAVLTMVFGPADLLPEVEREIARTPVLQTRVRAVGVVAHELLAACYSAADVFVLGSHAEGSGHTLIEAMACGMVPVVTDIPSFRALADDGRVGAPWSPGDPKWLAAALTVSGGRRRLPGRAG